ncbi:MAG TPA: hypothetical protein VHV08_07025, partial [Pirellulales bacterium]|nr:hypothetical protein [Pirellulales bacterium]
MSSYLHLTEIQFKGPGKEASIPFARGVNVICGASETGKSFLSEAVDFKLGGSSLREIPEKVSYASISLAMGASDGTSWKLDRAIAGGDFSQTSLDDPKASPVALRQSHAHDRVDNVSGLLLSKTGLLGKRILKSVKTGQTISLSFRNLARLVIIQD